jgi:hypothetical protein
VTTNIHGSHRSRSASTAFALLTSGPGPPGVRRRRRRPRRLHRRRPG